MKPIEYINKPAMKAFCASKHEEFNDRMNEAIERDPVLKNGFEALEHIIEGRDDEQG